MWCRGRMSEDSCWAKQVLQRLQTTSATSALRLASKFGLYELCMVRSWHGWRSSFSSFSRPSSREKRRGWYETFPDCMICLSLLYRFLDIYLYLSDIRWNKLFIIFFRPHCLLILSTQQFLLAVYLVSFLTHVQPWIQWFGRVLVDISIV